MLSVNFNNETHFVESQGVWLEIKKYYYVYNY